MIHEAIGNQSAIAKIAAAGVRIALDAGWRVSVVAKYLDPELGDRVEWLRLFVPPRMFFVQWTTAELFIRAALRGRRFDVVHAHQPQAAALSDVFQCHFLTRVAYERNCLEERTAPRARLIRLEQQGVLYAEDHYYRRWNRNTRMVFCSTAMRDEFVRLYGAPPRQQVLVHPFGPIHFPSDEERRRARKALVGDYPGPVVGYLGGVQRRKGYDRLIAGLARSDGNIADPGRRPFLLMGGPYADGFWAPELAGRFRSVGLVADTDQFYAACNVFAVPSCFEPLGLVAFEAAARGVPVIATREVAALPHLLECGAGALWNPAEPLEGLVHHMASRRTQCHLGAMAMAERYGAARYGEQLLRLYDDVRAGR
jgi:glycosyltransferase involved in cell wall biosynthesis